MRESAGSDIISKFGDWSEPDVNIRKLYKSPALAQICTQPDISGNCDSDTERE